ncbi:MAG: GNAT family N-acetyltransferase, partial [Candidatus Sericytochromatia bacterium]|nr:GNAT family N-acetyltransferase [Candidatus Sericytochromatia bacterium]
MSLKIREAKKEDIELILYFIKELAIYEKEPDAAVATHDGLLKDG